MEVESSPDDPDAASLQWALAKVTPGSPALRRLLPYRLCEVICAYKLIDILYDLQEQDSPSPFDHLKRLSEVFKVCL